MHLLWGKKGKKSKYYNVFQSNRANTKSGAGRDQYYVNVNHMYLINFAENMHSCICLKEYHVFIYASC